MKLTQTAGERVRAIGYFSIPGIEQELACNGGSCGRKRDYVIYI